MKSLRFLFKLVILVGMIVFSVSLQERQVTASSQDEPLPRDLAWLTEDHYVLDEALPGEMVESIGTATEAVTPWSKIATQSFRDGNWEIYLTNWDGSAPFRLTYDSNSDIQPRLNRDSTRVVFVSGRTGNYDIYSVNADGTGLTQLTTSQKDDVYPSLSADGKRIAFQSYRDGQAEIYVMNADGTNQTRLTVNNGYDGQPCWSPDMSHIAFTSQRYGQVYIYSIDNTGGGLTKVTNTRYSENAAWSPDGSHIAFDAEFTTDGFYELGVVDANGANEMMLVDVYPEREEDLKAKSWSPDGRYIGFTRINLARSGGVWYWTSAYLYALDYYNSDHPVYQLTGSNLDWNPDWQSMDLFPPISMMDRLPAFSRDTSFEVSWSGADSGPAPLYNFDVQYRVGPAGAWTNWWMATVNRTANYFGTAGDTVYFRVRARDGAANEEAWLAGDGDTFTYIFKGLLDGFVRDNRDYPLAGIHLLLDPGMVETVVSQPDGSYVGHTLDLTSRTASINQAGYAIYPATQLELNPDKTKNFNLVPSDNLITNGDFETNTLDGWQINGKAQATSSADPVASGSSNASLDMVWQPDDSFEIEKYNPTGDAFSGTSILDNNDVLHVFWHEAAGYIHITRTTSGIWSEPELMNIHPSGPGVFIGIHGTMYMYWDTYDYQLSEYKFYYSTSADGTIWSTPELIFEYTYYSQPSISYAMTVDHLGGLHLTWSEYQAGPKYFYKPQNGSWTTLTSFFESYVSGLKMIVGTDGILHLMWTKYDVYTGSATVYLKSRTAAGVWDSAPEVVLSQDVYFSPILFESSDGTLYLGYADTEDVYLINRATSGVWTEPINLSSIRDSFNDYAMDSLFVEPDGTIHVVMDNSRGELFYRVRYADQTWSTIWNFKPLPGGSIEANRDEVSQLMYGNRSGALTAIDGKATYIQTMYTPSAGIWATTLSIPLLSESSLSQTVTIPADMVHPTLGFLYRPQPYSSLESEFQVKINDTVLFATDEPQGDWSYKWYDLSAWAGEEVTLTFYTYSVKAGQPMYIYLDGISIGPWMTPLITDVTPGSFETWDNTVITIHGENFVQTPTVRLGSTLLENVVWIDEHTLQAEIPASLAAGLYDLWVINPQGQAGLLPAAMKLGKWIYLPAILR